MKFDLFMTAVKEAPYGAKTICGKPLTILITAQGLMMTPN
jgi:hypothetical protein